MRPSASDVSNASILLVDDTESMIEVMEVLLGQAGYTSVVSTMDPHLVCTLHLKNRYDLILLDLHMPGMDGFQVMEALKANETDSSLPVIVLSAQPTLKARALQAGAWDFIAKPFDVVELKNRIHNMLEARLLSKKLESFNNASVTESVGPP